MSDIANLGFAVDTGGLQEGKAALEALAPAALKAETAVDKLEKKLGATGSAADKAATGSRSLVAEQTRMMQAANGVSGANDRVTQTTRGLTVEQSKAAKSANDLAKANDDLRAKYDPLYAVIRKYKDNVAEIREANQLGALSTDKMNAALSGQRRAALDAMGALKGAGEIENLGHKAAVSSVAVRELLTIIREGGRGDFTRMAGSVSILAQSVGALNLLMTPLGLSIAGVAVAFIAGTAAALLYQSSIDKLVGVTEGLGRISGITGDQLLDAANKAAASGEITTASARSQAVEFAASGAQSADVITGLIAITDDYARMTGETAANANKELAAAMVDPVKGAETMNEKLGFLNDTQMQQIKQLVAVNDRLGAQKLLLDALSPAMVHSTSQTYGLAGAWKAVSDWASNAATNIGRALAGYAGMAPAARLASLTQERDRITDNGRFDPHKGAGGVTGWISGNTELADELDRVNKQINDTRKEINDTRTQSTLAQANMRSVAGGNAARSIFPDNATLSNLRDQQRVLFEDMTRGADSTVAHQKMVKNAYDAVTDTISRVTDANGNYITSEQRSHQIAVLQAQIGATRDKQRKGELTQQLALLRVGTEIVSNQTALTRAQDAASIVSNRASGSGRTRHPKTDAEKFADIVTGADNDISTQKARADAVQLSAVAAATLEQKTKLLNEAQSKDIALTATMRQRIDELAASYGKAKVAADDAKSLRDLFEGADKDIANLRAQAQAIGLVGRALAYQTEMTKLLNEAQAKKIPLDTAALLGFAKKASIYANQSSSNASDSFMNDLTKNADERMRALREEQSYIGKSADEVARLRIENELLAQARQKNIDLTPADIAAIHGIASEQAETEKALRKTQERLQFARDTARGFLTDLTSGLREGKTLWESFADAAVNALNKIMDKMLDQLFNKGIDALINLIGGLGGGLSGGDVSGMKSIFDVFKGGFADGGVFTNGIVTSPTMFAFAKGGALGLMGEAGPEAIMPLQRGSDGSLGVQMYGGGAKGGMTVHAPVTVNNYTTLTGALSSADIVAWQRKAAEDTKNEVKRSLMSWIDQFQRDGAVV